MDRQPPVGEQDRRCPDDVQRTDDITRTPKQVQPERDEALANAPDDLGVGIRIGIQPIAAPSGILEDVDQDGQTQPQRIGPRLLGIAPPLDHPGSLRSRSGAPPRSIATTFVLSSMHSGWSDGTTAAAIPHQPEGRGKRDRPAAGTVRER